MDALLYLHAIGANMVMREQSSIVLSISCPSGTMVVDSIVYASIDDVTCPPTSVIDNPSFNGINDGVTSFSFWTSPKYFHFLCPTTNNKVTITYRCQTNSGNKISITVQVQVHELFPFLVSGPTFKSIAGPDGYLQMNCPQGEINVTSIISPSKKDPGCADDDTTFIRSIIPPKTSKVYFLKYGITNCSVSNEGNFTIYASYDCLHTGKKDL